MQQGEPVFRFQRLSRPDLLTQVWIMLQWAGQIQDVPELLPPLQKVKTAALRLSLAIPNKEQGEQQLSDMSQQCLHLEEELDTQVGHLFNGLQYLARLGDVVAGLTLKTLFPKGLQNVTRPSGRPQLTIYTFFATQLSNVTLPESVWQHAQNIQAGIRNFEAALLAKEVQHQKLQELTLETVNAELELRETIQELEKFAAFFLKPDVRQQWVHACRGMTKKNKTSAKTEAVAEGT